MIVRVQLQADTPFLPQSRSAVFSFTVRNEGEEPLKGVPYLVIRKPSSSEPAYFVVFDETDVPIGHEVKLCSEVNLQDLEGEILVEASFEREGKVLATDTRRFYIYSEGPPIYVAFVWHFHQAPQFYPEGVYKDEWPFLHVHTGSFYGYKGGPYSVHVQLHERVPGWKDVDHFSPSLLEQWVKAVEQGYRLAETVVAPTDARVLAIKDVLEKVKEISRSGDTEFLGSVYAHTVLGFLLREARRYGIDKLVRFLISWELEEGLGIVESVLGHRPRGVWTPEMFWHMDLVKIYKEHGVEYTVLCEQHFRLASGEKDTIYEPYIVRDEANNELVVFFRDLALSDWISFRANFQSMEEAAEAAWNFAIEIAKRRAVAPGGIVVIALDGENWMIMPEYRRYAPVFMERLASLIARSGVMRLTTLGEYIKDHPPKRVLRYIPAGSWIGLSDAQWVGGVKSETWEKVMMRLKPVEALLEALGEEQVRMLLQRRVDPVYSAFKAAAISLDSDFYWYGDIEREREFVVKWAEEAKKLALSVLSAVRVEARLLDESLLEIKLVNTTGLLLKISLVGNGETVTVRLSPFSEKKVFLSASTAPVEVKAGEVTLTSLK